MKRGDVVRLVHEGVSVDAFVALASENGASLLVMFDALLDGCVGSMPLYRGGDGQYRNIMTGTPITVEEVYGRLER